MNRRNFLAAAVAAAFAPVLPKLPEAPSLTASALEEAIIEIHRLSLERGALISLQPTCMWVAPRTAMLFNNAFECQYFDLDGDGRSLTAA